MPDAPMTASTPTGVTSSPSETVSPTRFVVMVWIVAMLFTSIPYVYAWWRTPPGREFVGLVDKVPDGMSYLSKMRQGWEGNWLFENRYSFRDHPPVFLNILFLSMGHIARWLHSPLIIIYQASRFLFSFWMLWSVYAFFATWIPGDRSRRLALILFAFASGLGWLYYGISGAFPGNQQPVDVWVPEAIPFYTMMVNPHFCISIALMAHIATTMHRVVNGIQRCWDWLSIPASILLALIHPYDLITLEAILFTSLAVVLILRRPIRGLPLWVLLAMAPIPVLAYDAYLYRVNPVIRELMSNIQCPSPALIWYLCGYAPLLLLTFLALKNRAWGNSVPIVAGVWLLLGLPLTYLPIAFQRRLIMGWAVPLSGFAGLGIEVGIRRLLPRTIPLRLVASAILCGALTLTNLLLIARNCRTASDASALAYIRKDAHSALQWLSRQSAPRETVLTSPQMGLLVPVYAGNRVVVGHWSDSEDFFRLCGIANEFLSDRATPSFRAEVIRDYGVRWVLSDDGELKDANRPSLRCVLKRGRVVLYEAGQLQQSMGEDSHIMSRAFRRTAVLGLE